MNRSTITRPWAIPLATICGALFLAHLLAPAARAAEEPFFLFVMKADGTEVRKLPMVEGFHDHSSARFSHDGKQIAFDAASPPNGARTVFVVNTDGTELRSLGMTPGPIGRPMIGKSRLTSTRSPTKSSCKTWTARARLTWPKASTRGGRQTAASWP